MKFFKDNISNSYDRSVITLLDVFGNVGGIMGLISVLGGLIVTFSSSKLFMFSILSSLYQVEEPDTKYQENSIIDDNINASLEEEQELPHTPSSSRKVETDRNDLAKKAHNRMRRRLRYDWNLADFIYNSFSFLSCLCFCIKKKRPMNVKDRHKLYKKGEEKFTKEFDAVYYAKSLRNLNTLVNSLLDDSEKFMINFQRRNAI
mmetsp:Transcript_7776/g.6873  ORF Transcript_7776/g.6873 Transcript_7776/m.6873 type:complete len:203 (+) Transcript_7776:1003-1611(+)